jgi:opacity protein-like surface antigen
MKKILLTAVAVFAFSLTNAQDVKFGAKAGLNFSSLANAEGAKTQVGFHVGGYATISVSDKFAVQPELLYSAQGAKFDGDVNYNLSYINIPVMAKFYVADKFNLEAGPQIGLLMSATAKSSAGSLDLKENSKTMDFGLNFGAGYDVAENINVGLRYCLGLSQLEKELAPGQTATKNTNIQLSLGYRF